MTNNRTQNGQNISDGRLALAKKCGADYIANTKVEDFNDAMLNAFGPDKADCIYDCAGNDTTMGQAIKYARKGSKIILVAVFAGMANVDLAVLNDHELDLDTTMMSAEPTQTMVCVRMPASLKRSLRS